MRIVSGIAPRALRLAGHRQELSQEARRRLNWMDYYEQHGTNAALTWSLLRHQPPDVLPLAQALPAAAPAWRSARVGPAGAATDLVAGALAEAVQELRAVSSLGEGQAGAAAAPSSWARGAGPADAQGGVLSGLGPHLGGGRPQRQLRAWERIYNTVHLTRPSGTARQSSTFGSLRTQARDSRVSPMHWTSTPC